MLSEELHCREHGVIKYTCSAGGVVFHLLVGKLRSVSISGRMHVVEVKVQRRCSAQGSH